MLSLDERANLVAAIAQLYDFTEGPRSRRVLLEQAGLRRFVPAIDLSGTPNTVAGNLVGLLEAFGPLPDRPTHDALGALLAYLLRLPDLPRDAALQMARLVVVHGLVGDPAYIAELRTTYGVKDAVLPAAPAIATAPAPGVSAPPAPAFVADVANPKALERVINSEDNFLDIFLLSGAVYSAQAVCRIERPKGEALGTGFLVGPDLLLTNQHVLPSADALDGAWARFGYQVDATTVAAAGREFGFVPGFYFSSPPEALDFALVRLASAPLADITVVPAETDTMFDLMRKGKHRGYLPLAPRLLQEHDRVNVIQHPDGRPLKVVMTQNYVVKVMADTRVQYVADTMEGSSGSPVFNQTWEVVALHHSGEPYPPEAPDPAKPWRGQFRANEGVPARALLRYFKDNGLERYLPRS